MVRSKKAQGWGPIQAKRRAAAARITKTFQKLAPQTAERAHIQWAGESRDDAKKGKNGHAPGRISVLTQGDPHVHRRHHRPAVG